MWSARTLDLSLALYSDCDRVFSADHGNFRVCFPIGCSMPRFSVTSDISESWWAVETSDVPYALKPASSNNSVCRWHRQPVWVELRRTRLLPQPFHLIVNLWCRLALKERATTTKIKREPEQKQGGEGAAELLPKKSHATASLISKCFLPELWVFHTAQTATVCLNSLV